MHLPRECAIAAGHRSTSVAYTAAACFSTEVHGIAAPSRNVGPGFLRHDTQLSANAFHVQLSEKVSIFSSTHPAVQ